MISAKNIHRSLILRLLAAWLSISLLIGGIMFIMKMRDVDEFVKKLTFNETRALIDDKKDYINSTNPKDLATLKKMMAEHIMKGHFVLVELYDKSKNRIVDFDAKGSEDVENYIEKHKETHVLTYEVRYNRFYFEKNIYIQIFLPLYDKQSNLIGHFEGVYMVDAKTTKDITRSIVISLLNVVAAMLAITIVLYPIILSMDQDLIKLSRDLSEANVGMLETLGSAVAKRDSDTNAHNYRVTLYAVELAEALGLDAGDIMSLIKGSFLHDIGKIAISDNILLKPGKLTDEEFSVMKTHVRHGYDIISKYNWLKDAGDIVKYHHEKYNGTGYMSGLKGGEIPLNARIFAIVDVFDALTSKRPYKEPFGYEKTMQIIEEGIGSHFDPQIAETFKKMAGELYDTTSTGEETFLENTLHKFVKKYF